MDNYAQKFDLKLLGIMSCPSCGKGRKKTVDPNNSFMIETPSPAIWGPAMWTILHVFAERAGQNTNTFLRNQEIREFEMLVRALPIALPCAACQKHAAEYIRTHALIWSGKTGPENRDTIRRWFYDFHDHVNKTKETATISIPYDEVERRYGAIYNLNDHTDIFLRQLHSGLRFHIVKHDAANKFKKHLLSLRSFIGV